MQIAPTHSQLINPVNFRHFAAQDRRLWETDHFYIRFNLRHISHCCLVPAIRSHSVTHCARCRSVCFIVPLGMHTAVSQPYCLTVRAKFAWYLCCRFCLIRLLCICLLSSANKLVLSCSEFWPYLTGVGQRQSIEVVDDKTSVLHTIWLCLAQYERQSKPRRPTETTREQPVLSQPTKLKAMLALLWRLVILSMRNLGLI